MGIPTRSSSRSRTDKFFSSLRGTWHRLLGLEGSHPSHGGHALVAGWFSYEDSDFTAGDLLASDLACKWLTAAGYTWDVALVAPLTGGVDLATVDPASYDVAVFVCGPFMPNPWEIEFFARFESCPTVGLNLTMPVPLETWDPFQLLFERDSSRTSNPDLTFLSAHPLVPVVGVCLVEEYPPAHVQAANAAVQRLVAANEIAVVTIDTRLDVNASGLRTKAEVESLLARMDVVVTTRLHGTVLSLKNGVPVVAIDPEPGGAKIRRQAETIGWPIVFNVDDLDDGELQRALDYCLTREARLRASRCRDVARAALSDLRQEFITKVRQLAEQPK